MWRMWRMWVQMGGLLLCIVGWGSVGITLGMDRWRVAGLGGRGGSSVLETSWFWSDRGGSSVLETSWFWSDLWKDCYEDSSGLVNCVDLGVIWNVKTSIQTVRCFLLSGLFLASIQTVRWFLLSGLSLGLIGSTLMLFGLQCTRLGGDQSSKNRTLLTASALHVLGCVSDVSGFCLYVNTMAAAFLHSKADPSTLRYEMGAPLYVGLMGSFLILFGCLLQCASVCTDQHQNRYEMGAPLYVGLMGSFLILFGCLLQCASVCTDQHQNSRNDAVPPIREKEESLIRRQKHKHEASERSSVSLYKPPSVVIV